MELKEELLRALEERLVQHDNCRKDIQSQLQEICSRFIEEANLLEEKINREIEGSLNEKEEHILNFIEKLNNYEKKNNNDLDFITKQVQEELSCWKQYEIKINAETKNFVDQYYLEITEVKNEDFNFEGEIDIRNTVTKLQENLNKTHQSVTSVQNQLTKIITERKGRGDEIMKRINEELERSFPREDARIQEVVNSIKMKSDEISEELITKVKLTLLINQKYSLLVIDGNDYKLTVTREASLKWINFEERKSSNIIVSFTNRSELLFSFKFFSNDEIKLLKTLTDPSFKVTIKMWEKNKNEERNPRITTMEYVIGKEQLCLPGPFLSSTTYCLIVKIEYKDLSSKWSDKVQLTTPEFKDFCIWKECPDDADEKRKYFVDENNPRIATNIGSRLLSYCTTIGNTPLPPNKVTSWNIKILKSKWNNGFGIYIGVAPFNINQNEEKNYEKCGWYLYCYYSKLYSGLPHKYKKKEYGVNKEEGTYVRTGDSVGVVMDTTKGELSFVLNNVNLGVAYEGIPLDKPLVPCVILAKQDDSVEFDLTSEVKENVDTSVPVPSNIVSRSDTWDSITLTWDIAEGASFYQIEVDGSNSGDAPIINTFTKSRLLPETEYSLKVRAVKDNKVSKWSDIMKGKTLKESFKNGGWKESPGYVYEKMKYSVDEKNLRIATKVSADYSYSTIIGNTPIPLNKVTSWNVKILQSKNNDGSETYVGVAPFDIIKMKTRIIKNVGGTLVVIIQSCILDLLIIINGKVMDQ